MRSGKGFIALAFSILSGLAGVACSSDPSAEPLPPHVTWAELAVATIDPADNEYASAPSYLEWGGHDSAPLTKNRSVCATFLSLLLARSYGLTSDDFAEWTGSTSPSAALYHQAIVDGRRFEPVPLAPEIAIGDIIAIQYPDAEPATGHVMVVVGLPALRAATPPVLPGTPQYEIEIIDSSATPHGPADTRDLGGGALDTGVGEGVFRLYTNADGTIAGHTWSTEDGSPYFNQSERSLVVGRLINTTAAPINR